MAFNRKTRLWSIIIGIPILLLLIAVIAAKIYFTSDRLKALVIPPGGRRDPSNRDSQ